MSQASKRTYPSLREIDAKPWPTTIKEWSKKIIIQRQELKSLHDRVASIDMLDPAKAEGIAKLAKAYEMLSRSYASLQKELVYHLAHPKR